MPCDNQRMAEKRIDPMLFKTVTRDDLPKIDEYLSRQKYGTCDYTELGILMWAKRFGYQYSVENGVLYLRGIPFDKSEKWAYFLPVAKDIPLQEAINNILSFAAKEGRKEVLFTSVPEAFLKELSDHHASESVLTRDWSDYTYNAIALSSLKGKEYSHKRNQIRQFMDNNRDYVFEPLTKDNIPAVLTFERDFAGKNATSENAIYENRETIEVLEHYEDYKLVGALLRENKRLIAFSVGEVIGDIFYDHIEKADREEVGGYQTINYLFANDVVSRFGVRIINREEDTGDLGLREAKLQFSPTLINKYTVKVKI